MLAIHPFHAVSFSGSTKRRRCEEYDFTSEDLAPSGHAYSQPRPMKRARLSAPEEEYVGACLIFGLLHCSQGPTLVLSEDESDSDSMDIDIDSLPPPSENPMNLAPPLTVDWPLAISSSRCTVPGYRASSTSTLFAPGRFKRRDTFGSVSRMDSLMEEEELV